MDPRQRVTGLQENLCVTAGAGAGKTSCLVEAYLGLLSDKPHRPAIAPNEILAITFADKAAAEMRSRIAARVQELCDAGQAGQGLSPGLLPALEWAPICTIHSFCGDLLREFGAALGLNPDFGVLDEPEFEALRSEVLERVLTGLLGEGDPVLTRVLGQYNWQGRGGLGEVLLLLVQRFATLGLSLERGRDLTAEAHRQAQESHAGLMADMDQAVSELTAGIIQKKYNKSAQYYKKINKFLEYWPGLRKALSHDPPEPRAIRKAQGLIAGGWGKAKDQRNTLKNALESLAGLVYLPGSASLSDDLLVLAEQVARAIDRELKKRAMLSFDHLLLESLRLLEQGGEVLGILRRRFQAVVVDEYQDINPVQGRIIGHLAALDPSAGQGEGGPLLLVVGDRKQSIYAFRGADVSLFSQTMRVFGRRDTLVALAENFRSSHKLVEFFNRLFKQVFQVTGDTEDPADFAVRFGQEDIQVPAAPSPGTAERPVSVLDCRELAPPKTPAEAWRAREARALAGYLSGIFDQGVDPANVVLLFRRLTQVRVYEDALALAGHPFYTVRGSGFYECQEVVDLAWTLRAILDPGDSLALAGLLRSPLVGLSDESLWALCHPGADDIVSLAEALSHKAPLPAWLGETLARRWESAVDLVNTLAPVARRLEPAELLRRVIEACDLPAVLAAGHDGEQLNANLRKLIETAREGSIGRGDGVAGFVRGLWEMVQGPPRSAQQAPLAGEDTQAVRLMTVHQAKGLEFDIVVLPDLGGAPRGENASVLVDQSGVVAASPYDPFTGSRVKSAVYQGISEENKQRQAAEYARLFYVACTRARRRLVFSITGSTNKNTWAKWVEQWVLQDPAVQVVNAGDSLPPKRPRQGRAQAWPGWLPPEPGPRSADGESCVKKIIDRAPRTARRFSESVTGLGNWLKCPRRYIWVRRYGLDTANILELRTNEDVTSQGGVQLGTLVHRVLELTDLEAGPEAAMQTLESLVQGMSVGKNYLQQARERVASWWDTELPGIIADNPRPLIGRELGFRVALPAGDGGPDIQLLGNIDLVLSWDDGRELIIDYKVTDKIDIQPYIYQLALYGLALGKKTTRVQNVPNTAILFLGPDGAVMRHHRFTRQDLEEWEQRVRQAACEILRLGPEITPTALPVPADCQPGQCPLAPICRPEATFHEP